MLPKFTCIIARTPRYRLIVNMQIGDGSWRHAEYDEFSVSSERDGYKLHVRGYSGTAGELTLLTLCVTCACNVQHPVTQEVERRLRIPIQQYKMMTSS